MRADGATTRWVIIGFLLIGALLVDRFVLLPEFDGGRGSDEVAVGAWLGVNLLPAIVWLLLNAREGERSRGQLLAGTLALATTTAVLIVPVLIWWTATGDTAGDVAQANPSLSPTSEAEQLAERCGAGDSEQRTAAVREHFVDAAPSAPVSLLMEGTRFQPGEKFSIAVRNDSATEVMHGAGTTIEDVDTGDTVKLDVEIATLSVAFIVPSGQAGPCVRLDSIQR